MIVRKTFPHVDHMRAAWAGGRAGTLEHAHMFACVLGVWGSSLNAESSFLVTVFVPSRTETEAAYELQER